METGCDCVTHFTCGTGLIEQEGTERTERISLFALSTLLSQGVTIHALFSQASRMTHGLIGAAIEVHKDKGPGLLESIYEWCLAMELEMRGHQVQSQDTITIRYKQFRREEPLRFNLLIDKCLLVEVEAVEEVRPIHKTQLLSYMKLLDVPLGLIINFHALKLTDDVSRLILPGANFE